METSLHGSEIINIKLELEKMQVLLVDDEVVHGQPFLPIYQIWRLLSEEMTRDNIIPAAAAFVP